MEFAGVHESGWAPLGHHDVIRPKSACEVKAVVRRTSSEDRLRPGADVGRIEIPQRSALLLHCYMLSLGDKARTGGSAWEEARLPREAG
jgi:hypothetical protein